MVKEQLLINNIEVELLESIEANFTYSISDIKNPDQRKADYSKTVVLAGSKTINKLFGHIFEINIDGTFNPNLKADVTYLIDSEVIFDGILKLNKVIKNDNDLITYEVVMFGRLANLFNEIGDLELTDIQDLDDFDHTYTNGHQSDSWATQIEYNGGSIPFQLGNGYVYPLINYGFNNDLTTYDVTHLFPAFYAKEYFERIISDAGFTYSSPSNFFNNQRFTRLIIPYNGGNLALSDAQIEDRLIDVDTPESTAGLSTMLVTTGGATTPLRYTNEITDPTNQHNTTTGIWTVGEKGYYNINASLDANFDLVPSGAPSNVVANFYIRTLVQIKVNGTVVDGGAYYVYHDASIPNTGYTTSASPTYPDYDYWQSESVVLDYIFSGGPQEARNYNPENRLAPQSYNQFLDAGDTVEIVCYNQIKLIDITEDLFEDAATSGTFYGGTVTGNILSGVFKNQVVNNNILEGNTIDMYQTVPRDIKQKDFLMSLVKMFNLFIEPDKDNERNLIIDTRDEFYNSEVVDWSEKLDISQDLEMLPMGELDAGEYLFTYKADKDYYNTVYTDTWSRVYGDKELNIDNDFLNNTKKTELIFSPTPIVGQQTQDRVVPTIIKVDDNNQAKRTESNIRILLYGGLISTVDGWVHGASTRFDYPFAGMIDDPFAMSFGINYALPKEIYYDNTYNTISLNDDNLYNRYWSKFITEITDKDSKIVKGWFLLTPSDIRKLSFQKLYRFDNAYFRLNKVENYNPKDYNLTKCEFLKLKSASVFASTIGEIIGGKGESIGNDDKPVNGGEFSMKSSGNNYNPKSQEVQGEDNYINQTADNIKVKGDNNRIAGDTKNIVIQGDNNRINAGIENVTLINSNDLTIDQSDVTYIDGVAMSGSDVVKEKSADFTPDLKVTTYEVDTSGGDVTINLPTYKAPPVPFEGKIWNFKKMEKKKKMIILANDIDGKISQTVKKQYTSLQIQFDGEKYIII